MLVVLEGLLRPRTPPLCSCHRAGAAAQGPLKCFPKPPDLREPPFPDSQQTCLPHPTPGTACLIQTECRLLPSQPGHGPRAAIHANPSAGLMRRSGQVHRSGPQWERMPEVIQEALLPSVWEASPTISFDPASTGEGRDDGGA